MVLGRLTLESRLMTNYWQWDQVGRKGLWSDYMENKTEGIVSRGQIQVHKARVGERWWEVGMKDVYFGAKMFLRLMCNFSSSTRCEAAWCLPGAYVVNGCFANQSATFPLSCTLVEGAVRWYVFAIRPELRTVFIFHQRAPCSPRNSCLVDL